MKTCVYVHAIQVDLPKRVARMPFGEKGICLKAHWIYWESGMLADLHRLH